MGQTLRIVNYAVNGSGAGHLTRLCAINRWLRRYAALLDLRAEIYFLTSSEADTLLFHEQFASFKMPSKTIVGETGIDKLTYLALAKQWVWHSLTLLRPDLLVVDTFPRGSFGELLSALDLCKHKAFIHRPVKEEFASRPDFQAMLPLYDVVLVPEYADHDAGVVRKGRANLRFVGPITVRERAELWSREQVRAHVSAQPGELLVYVSAGGGGDPQAAEILHRTCQVLLAQPDVRLVVGAGPLYRGRPLLAERVVWLQQPGAAELMAGFDVAICAAGYNSFYELMHAGVPTVFLPQEKVADEQDRRAARAAEVGAAFLLPGGHGVDSAGELRALIERLRDPAVRGRAPAPPRQQAPPPHPPPAAAELLRVVLPAHEVDAASAAIDDELLLALRAGGLHFEQLTDLVHALRPEATAAVPRPMGDRLGRLTEEALALLRFAQGNHIPPSALLRSVRLLAPRLGQGTPLERAAALKQVLAALAPFADWPAALSLVKLLSADRKQKTSETAGELVQFLSALHSRREDLFRGMAYLTSAHGTDGTFAGNRELLQAARAHMGRTGAAPLRDLEAPE
jgi:predicted glycosyltransferase